MARGPLDFTLSSAFSGVGGVEQASLMLTSCRAMFLGSSFKMENLFGIEMRAQSRYELAAFPEPPRCIFGDITDAIRADFRSALRSNAAKMRYTDLERIFRSPNILADDMVCYGAHGDGHRRCRVRRATMHWASTPCVSFSRLVIIPNSDPLLAFSLIFNCSKQPHVFSVSTFQVRDQT